MMKDETLSWFFLLFRHSAGLSLGFCSILCFFFFYLGSSLVQHPLPAGHSYRSTGLMGGVVTWPHPFISDTTIQHGVGLLSLFAPSSYASLSRYGGRREVPVAVGFGRRRSRQRERRAVSRLGAVRRAQQTSEWVSAPSLSLSHLHPTPAWASCPPLTGHSG